MWLALLAEAGTSFGCVAKMNMDTHLRRPSFQPLFSHLNEFRREAIPSFLARFRLGIPQSTLCVWSHVHYFSALLYT